MRTPPGPKGRFLTGNLGEFRADRLALFTRCAREFGDVVALRLLGRPVILLNRPDLIEQVLVHQSKNFVKHFGLRLYKPILGNGLVTSEGDFWRRQRKLSAPAFQASRLSGYADVMVDCTDRMARAWQRERDDPAAHARDVHADMMRLTLQIACKTLFGADACPDPDVVGAAMEAGLEAIALRFRLTVPLPEWLPTPSNLRLRRSMRTLYAVVDDLIASRRAAMGRGGGGDDLLSMLLSVRDEDGTQMTAGQLLDEVLTLLLAGHETTALALSYALHLLAQHPVAQAALRAELSDVLAGRLPTYADLPRLTCTRSVVNEAMRLYPPADFLGREAVADCTIGEVPVRRGTNLFMSQWVMHRDARYFPDPLKFDPGRWTDAFERALPRFAYFPFGGGPRYCIGQTFAIAEAALALAVICNQFEFAPDPTFRLELHPGITLRPRAGVRLIVRPVARHAQRPAAACPAS
jgi:cytochrome P450